MIEKSSISGKLISESNIPLGNKVSCMKNQDAETVALNVLNFLVGDETRLERFMAMSGIDPQALRTQASEPAFLAGILDYLLQDETLVYMFADEYNATPDLPLQARRALVGANSGETF